MKNYKKILFEACLAGVWMALAWSLRGQFGHLPGALIPGVCLALVPAFLMKEEHWRESIGMALVLGAAGFSAGGNIGYGVFFDAVAHASAFGEVKKEFWQLLAIGIVWGALGTTFLGFAFSEKETRAVDFAVLAGVTAVWALLLSVFNLDAWDVLLYAAGLAAIHAYNFFYKKSSIVWMFALAGGVAWGAGFLLSAIMLSAGYQNYLGQGWTWWVLRDQILGFTAGALFWLMISGLQNYRFRRQPVDKILAVQRPGFFVWIVLVPLVNTWNVIMHWLTFRSFENLFPFTAACGLYLFVSGLYLLVRAEADFLNPKIRKTLVSSALIFSIYMIAISIGKQWFAKAGGHWEEAYTFFLVSFAVLCGLVPLQMRKLP